MQCFQYVIYVIFLFYRKFFADLELDFIRNIQDIELKKIPSSAVFECEVNKVNTECVWFFHDLPLLPENKYQMESRGVIHRLILKDVDWKDEGDFKIAVMGKTSQARLSILGMVTVFSILPLFVVILRFLPTFFDLALICMLLSDNVAFGIEYTSFVFSDKTTMFICPLMNATMQEGGDIHLECEVIIFVYKKVHMYIDVVCSHSFVFVLLFKNMYVTVKPFFMQ